jgi:hypothetical protein
MTSKSRTIDNLGIDASIRYAQDQKLFEARFIEESQIVSRRTEVSVSTPYTPSEFDQMFGDGKPLIWAAFAPPPEMTGTNNTLFSYQLIPSLHIDGFNQDPEELLDQALEKQRQEYPDSSDQEKDQEKKEKAIIANLLKCVTQIDKSLQLINSRRNQYQRG